MDSVLQIRPDVQRKLDSLEQRWEQLCTDARNDPAPVRALHAVGDLLVGLEMTYKAYLSDLLDPPPSYRCPPCRDTGWVETDDEDAFFVARCGCQQGRTP